MIIVDTSVWIDQIRGLPTPLDELLGTGQIALHPFVLGELLLNGLPKSSTFVTELIDLPEAPVASAKEVAAFIVWAKLAGTGVGYVDTHLLMSARLMIDGRVLTRDGNLHSQAERLDVAYQS
jgi:predicted nucleic acid-binding protein